MHLHDKIDAEISASKKSARNINCKLLKTADGIYKGTLPFKIEGDYVLNSKNIENVLVSVFYENNQITIELDSDEEEIVAFLSKDETSLLEAIKKNIKQDNFSVEPSFIVGPPGTGKTKVITKIIEEAIKADKKILITSPTNMAVENVFERIDRNLLGIQNDDIVLTIKTEEEELLRFSPENIKRRKLQPIQDEISILTEAKESMLKSKKEIQPFLEMHRNSKVSIDTILANRKKELSKLNAKAKGLRQKIDDCEHRKDALSSNTLIKTVAQLFMGKKLEEIAKEQEVLENEFLNISNEISDIEKKIEDVEKENLEAQAKYTTAREEMTEIESAIGKINNEIKELHKQEESLQTNNVFKDAKIVGATLVNAALNQKIQAGEFDMIIVDEASMALVPLLLVVSQSLRDEKKISKLQYEFDDAYYEAQNKAIEMAINKRIIFVGDPKQLQPIAKTHDMRCSIFTVYDVEDIFNEKEVKNTVFLDTNFRNHPDITEAASKLFYGGMLKSGRSDKDGNSLYIKRSTSKMVSSQGSFVNHGNANVVVKQIELALKRGRRSIGVITPYRKQAELIEEKLNLLKDEYPDADIQAGTVHTFQGKEKDIIIFDLTFSPDKNVDYIPATFAGGFDSNTAKLLNVAMTRAESFFIVVGDVEGILNIKAPLVLKEWLKEIISL